MVILFHWLPNSHHFLLPLGSWGVELFFVLSGFLITKILLESRHAAETHQQTKAKAIKNFLLRRCLRIFPIYYLSLIVILLFDRTNASGVKDSLLYFFGYATNILYFHTQQFNYPVAHFWSLAVEEQFYLVWPWFILFLPSRFLKPFLIISIAVGILSRIVFAHAYSYTEVTPDVLTPCCFDGFSIGGLFAYFAFSRRDNLQSVIKAINYAGVGAFVVMMILLTTHFNKFAVLHRTISSVFFAALIANAFRGMKGVVGMVADNKVLLYLGQISYGLYIYHLLTPWLTKVMLNYMSTFKNNVIAAVTTAYNSAALMWKFSIDLIILLLVSSLSWYMVEKPINRYKFLFK